MSDLTTRDLLPYRMLKGVGPVAVRRIWDAARTGVRLDLAARYIPPVQKALDVPGAWAAAQDKSQEQLEAAAKWGARIVSPLDADYPPLLQTTKEDPFFLYVRGTLQRPEQSSVAVIGTREPTRHGVVIAERITQHLVERNVSIVSGLALGCDAAAHRACLAQGGHTVAVLGHGLQQIEPPEHQELADAILEADGALISEFGFGAEPKAQLFVRRDYTQAAMSNGAVMIQSDTDGGSLHASRAALSYGRWLAVPYPTAADVTAQAPQIKANLVIGDGTPEERCALLKCDAAGQPRVLILRSKEDYQQLDRALGA